MMRGSESVFIGGKKMTSEPGDQRIGAFVESAIS